MYRTCVGEAGGAGEAGGGGGGVLGAGGRRGRHTVVLGPGHLAHLNYTHPHSEQEINTVTLRHWHKQVIKKTLKTLCMAGIRV